MSLCNTRLRKEFKDLQKKPVENIRAAPRETNILEWHYVIEGQKGSPFEGGYYHGVVTFPSDYPYKPPSIQMLTPNGRFKVPVAVHHQLGRFTDDLFRTHCEICCSQARGFACQCLIFTRSLGTQW